MFGLSYIEIGVVFLHLFVFLYEFIHNLLLGKKIKKICKDCGQPVYDDYHKCLNSDQLSKLVDFVSSLRGDNCE